MEKFHPTSSTANALYRKFETTIPEMKLPDPVPNFYVHVSVNDLPAYIFQRSVRKRNTAK
jgi:hypothetical protein